LAEGEKIRFASFTKLLFLPITKSELDTLSQDFNDWSGAINLFNKSFS
jgi:hypothetical protein